MNFRGIKTAQTANAQTLQLRSLKEVLRIELKLCKDIIKNDKGSGCMVSNKGGLSVKRGAGRNGSL